MTPADQKPTPNSTQVPARQSPANLPAAPASVELPSGRTLSVSSSPGGDHIEVRAAGGQLEIRISLTPEGPVLSLSGAKLEINSSDSVNLNCRDLNINTTGSLNLASQGSLALSATGNITAKALGNTDIDAQVVNLNCGPRTDYNDEALPKFVLPEQPVPPQDSHGGCSHAH